MAEYASTHLSRNVEVELGNMGSLQGTDQARCVALRCFVCRWLWGGLGYALCLPDVEGFGPRRLFPWEPPTTTTSNKTQNSPRTNPPKSLDHQVSKALVRAFERTDRGVIQKVHHAFEIGLGNVAKVRI